MYRHEHTGLSAPVKEGQTWDYVWDELERQAIEKHFNKYKELYEMRGTVERTIEPIIQTNESSKEKQVLAIIASINTCTELKVLESYRLIAKSNPQIQEAYNNKLNQLQ
jgi:hypothetical protein